MKLKNICFIFLLVLSCKTTESQKTNNSETLMDQKQMLSAGFKKGLIEASKKEGDCPYVIKFQKGDNTFYYDPIDLPDEYKKDEAKIWFKFTPSRRPNRCNKANPVILNDSIQLRK